MCGRFTLLRLADFTDMFPWIRQAESILPPRYNIAPTQPVAVVANRDTPHVEMFHWGLVPSWAKDPSIGGRLINARAETLAEKPSFRAALRRRRCLIPASGFYEWRREPDGAARTPMHIRLRAAAAFAFAGLWEIWRDPGGAELLSCTIITTRPNELLRDIHDRMPVILPPERCREWLAPGERPPDALLPLLEPYPGDAMEAFAVSRLVNSPRNESPACIAPATPPADAASGDLKPPTPAPD